jgi:hypothetical protein
VGIPEARGPEGAGEGAGEGAAEVGISVASIDGMPVGSIEGLPVGSPVGIPDGSPVGTAMDAFARFSTAKNANRKLVPLIFSGFYVYIEIKTAVLELYLLYIILNYTFV